MGKCLEMEQLQQRQDQKTKAVHSNRQ